MIETAEGVWKLLNVCLHEFMGDILGRWAIFRCSAFWGGTLWFLWPMPNDWQWGI